MNQKDFIAQYSEQIEQVINQDAVRAETLHREWQQGQLQPMIADSIAMGAFTFQAALKNGFDADQAFTIMMNQVGFDYHN